MLNWLLVYASNWTLKPKGSRGKLQLFKLANAPFQLAVAYPS